jgi:CheY-like chemotaxis protein
VPYKLLLADDSVTIQRVIELTFADEDIQVIAVSDGDQAIARLDADPPDIVLADVGMPGRDGYEVAAYVKQSPRLSHIPVVLLTGAFEPVDQARANSVGCDGVLAKPFEPQLVIGRVKELLGRAGRAPLSIDANLAPPVAAIEPWTPPLTDAPFHAPLESAQPAADAYFDRLDAAFANLSGGDAAPPAKPAAPTSPVADSIDWFGSKPGATPADLPLSYASRKADFDPSGASGSSRAPSRDERQPAPPAPRMEPSQARGQAATSPPRRETVPEPAPRPTLPPLADAFAALLAAEQSTPASPDAPTWPASAPAGPAVTDDLIERITRRVLERLSDRVVRDTVSEIVSAVAERLVREEIERIKGAIK